ncbi:copper resistance protein CopC [Planomonospora corallina]|uniref:Copper resistance protein CopC n=1 Tax=Planomonospora corallina TaxID=1806052 RepID=A0ABV8I9F3_9ACTN
MKTSPYAAVLALLAALLLGTVLGTALASPALAHDALKSSDPAEGAKVESLEQVKLTFTARVRFPNVVVLSADGTPYHEGKPAADGPVVTQQVKDGLPPGKYVIAYRVVSSDGHPIAGEIPFTLTGAPDASPEAAPDGSAAPAESAAAASPTATATGGQNGAGAPADVSPVPAAGAQESGGVPGWAWLVFGGVTGIGIGLFISMRNKKQP